MLPSASTVTSASVDSACALMSVARSTWRYESRLVKRDQRCERFSGRGIQRREAAKRCHGRIDRGVSRATTSSYAAATSSVRPSAASTRASEARR